MSDWLGSLNGASTNFLTNTVDIGLSDKEFVCLTLPAFPLDKTPELLHEASHHWCFRSHFGNSVSLLRLQAYERASRKDQAGALRATIRYQTIIATYRPLLEGFALLVELDGFHIPGEGNSPILPYQALAAVTSSHPQLEKHRSLKASEFLVMSLALVRNQRSYVDIREHLLSGSELGVPRDYLVGYYCIKSLWMELQLVDSRFMLPEFFIKFLHLYFFTDYHLFNIVHDKTLNNQQFADAVINYLESRIENIVNIASNTELIDRIQSTKPGEAITLEQFVEYGMYDKDAPRGIEKSGEAMFEVFGNRPLNSETMPVLKVLNNRESLTLVSERVKIQSRSGKVSINTLNGNTIYSGTVGVDIDTETDGHFSSYLYFDPGICLVNTVSQDQNIVFRQFVGTNDEKFDNVDAIELNRAKVDAILQPLESHLNELLDKDQSFTEITSKIQTQKLDIYGRCRRFGYYSQYSEDTLINLLDYGVDSVVGREGTARFLAVLGVENSMMNRDIQELQSLMKEEGFDLNTELEFLETYCGALPEVMQASVWRLAVRYGDSVVSLL